VLYAGTIIVRELSKSHGGVSAASIPRAIRKLSKQN